MPPSENARGASCGRESPPEQRPSHLDDPVMGKHGGGHRRLQGGNRSRLIKDLLQEATADHERAAETRGRASSQAIAENPLQPSDSSQPPYRNACSKTVRVIHFRKHKIRTKCFRIRYHNLQWTAGGPQTKGRCRNCPRRNRMSGASTKGPSITTSSYQKSGRDDS